VETIFHAPFIWIKAWNQKFSGNQPGIVAYAVILQKGRVDFEDGWLIKSSFITKDELKACQLTRTKLPQKNTSAGPISCKIGFKARYSSQRKLVQHGID
jgi:hypothetical protein